jgi:hypothetical protein
MCAIIRKFANFVIDSITKFVQVRALFTALTRRFLPAPHGAPTLKSRQLAHVIGVERKMQ